MSRNNCNCSGVVVVSVGVAGGGGGVFGGGFRGAKLSRNNCNWSVVVVAGGVDVFGGAIGDGVDVIVVVVDGFRGAKLSRNNCNCSGVNVPPDWARLRLWEPLRLLCVLILELHRLLYRLHVLNCCRRRFFVLSCCRCRIKMALMRL